MKPFYAFLLCAASLMTTASASFAQRVVVVVNAANPVSTLTKNQVASIFLKKTLKWSNDTVVTPVNQERDAKIRDIFSREIHGRSASAMEAYWQIQIFSGKDVPPAVRANDTDVLAFVRARPGAIGYVSADTPLGDGVKVVTVKGS
jgi:ABC-type phosphate transport system substrate-binding protein